MTKRGLGGGPAGVKLIDVSLRLGELSNSAGMTIFHLPLVLALKTGDRRCLSDVVLSNSLCQFYAHMRQVHPATGRSSLWLPSLSAMAGRALVMVVRAASVLSRCDLLKLNWYINRHQEVDMR
jgi:hypothetical protein